MFAMQNTSIDPALPTEFSVLTDLQLAALQLIGFASPGGGVTCFPDSWQWLALGRFSRMDLSSNGAFGDCILPPWLTTIIGAGGVLDLHGNNFSGWC